MFRWPSAWCRSKVTSLPRVSHLSGLAPPWIHVTLKQPWVSTVLPCLLLLRPLRVRGQQWLLTAQTTRKWIVLVLKMCLLFILWLATEGFVSQNKVRENIQFLWRKPYPSRQFSCSTCSFNSLNSQVFKDFSIAQDVIQTHLQRTKPNFQSEEDRCPRLTLATFGQDVKWSLSQ